MIHYTPKGKTVKLVGKKSVRRTGEVHVLSYMDRKAPRGIKQLKSKYIYACFLIVLYRVANHHYPHQQRQSLTPDQTRSNRRHVGINQTHSQQHLDQVFATTTFFEPSDSDLSDEDIFNMDYTSGEDAFPVKILVNMVDNMVSNKREM